MVAEETTSGARRRPRAAGAWPWLDHAGRVSPLRLAVLGALALPAFWVAWCYGAGALGARPLNAAIHEIGNWALKLILLSLAVTPARRILDWPRLVDLRRMIGVAAFAYAAAHLVLYAADQAFDLAKIAGEIVRRIYLTIGFAALLVVAAMAATSTDGMMRRLGGRRWRRLHRLVFPATLLAVVHFFMQTKADVAEPWAMAGLFGWLMGWRLLARARGPGRSVPLSRVALLCLAAGLATALGEAAYFWLKLGVDPLRVLAADLTTATGIRPAWTVLAITLAVTAIGALRAGIRRPADDPPSNWRSGNWQSQGGSNP
jgi:sulfoxide reductase heme-binding subunit YedZ